MQPSIALQFAGLWPDSFHVNTVNLVKNVVQFQRKKSNFL